ncbi:MAG: hypothetical protein ACU83V_06730 [Gammaproteobacteria bacterium]
MIGQFQHRAHFAETEQIEQRLPGVAFDSVQVFDRTGQRNIQRVDVKLVNFQRLVGFVLAARIFEVLFQIGGADALADS